MTSSTKKGLPSAFLAISSRSSAGSSADSSSEPAMAAISASAESDWSATRTW